jgi:hypothetical protein
VLNGVEVCRLCRPLYKPEILNIKPGLDQFAGIFRVIILLKDGFGRLEIIKLNQFLKFFL